LHHPTDSLDRFLRAQERDYAQALRELAAGRKHTHWMWYVLPQLRGLGRSAMAHEYGVDGPDEARAYIAHPVLGPRLIECVNTMLAHRGQHAADILGTVDALKFRSSLTLFAEVAPEHSCFQAALTAFYEGAPDPQTLRLLGAAM
jgi:uncharacterized protein (DUF1810 family)